MPKIETQQFGPLEYDASIEFPLGLPGFDDQHEFVLITPASLAPVAFLQSAQSPGLCFTAFPVHAIASAYDLQLSVEDRALLLEGEEAEAGLLLLAIVSATETGGLTANLLAPVVINPVRRIAVQAVRADAVYSHCHPLGEGAVCS